MVLEVEPIEISTKSTLQICVVRDINRNIHRDALSHDVEYDL